MTSLNGKMYFGVYPGALIYEFDPAQSPVQGQNPKMIFDIGDEQDRPFAMTSGDNKLFIGTISDYGHLGGALTVYDGTTAKTFRNVVQDQSIIGLAYKDGKIYGSTTIWGGLGIEPSTTEAKMFVWDVAAEEKIAEFVPDIPQSGPAPKAIGGLSFGPDGYLWGASYGTIFAMDPNTFEIVKSKEIVATDWNFNHYWRPVHLRWSDDGLLYTTIAGSIVVIDPATLEHVTLQQTPLMTLGDDGHIYYADGANIKRINVKDGAPPVMSVIPISIENNSFEEPVENGVIPGWTSLYPDTPNVSYEVSSEQSYSGDYSLKIQDTSTTDTVALITPKIDVAPGLEYTASAKMYLQNGRSIFFMRFFDENDKILSTKAAYVTTGQGSWQNVTVSEYAPAGAKYALLYLWCSQYWMTTAFYDDIAMSYKDYKPKVKVVDPAQSLLTNDSTPTISVKVDQDAIVKVLSGTEVVGEGYATANEVASLTLQELADGVHPLQVVATNKNGTKGDSVGLPTITVDTTPPDAPTIISPEIPMSTNDPTPEVVVRAEANSEILILEDGVVVGKGVMPSEATELSITLNELSIGIHKLVAVAIDKAGNQSLMKELPHIIINEGEYSKE